MSDRRKAFENAARRYFGVCKACGRSHDQDGKPLLVAGRTSDTVVCIDCFTGACRGAHPTRQRIRTIAAAAALGVCLILATSPASAAVSHVAKVRMFVSREHRQLRTIAQAEHTIRFFARHPRIVIAPATARIARRIVVFRRAQISWTRRELAETRAVLRALRRPAVAHRAEWLCIYSHENAGYGWHANTGNSFYGGLQFMQSTWERNGGLRYAARADLATPDQQMHVAEHAWHESGGSFSQWPKTSRMCGLR